MRARIPADVDMPDRIFAGLTARQIAILGGHLLVLWALWAVIGRHVPLFVFGVLAVPVLALGAIWASAKVEGTTLERLAGAAFRHMRVPRHRVLAPEGVSPVPSWLASRGQPVAALDLPFDGAEGAGVLALHEHGSAVICRASSVNFALRSEVEQKALVDGFGRVLNALDAPVQFLIRSDRADLQSMVEDLERRALELPHPALCSAAREHAAFLRSLASRRDVLARQAFICFRDTGGDQAAAAQRLGHRVEEAETLLRGMGVRLARLEGTDAVALVARASDPGRSPSVARSSLPEDVVEGVR